MIRHVLPERGWKKSTYSANADDQCVESQPTADGRVAVGDSKSRPRGACLFPPSAWTAFTTALRGYEGAQPLRKR
ncbi:DUF397 domain-containing protein [Streptomyces sp. AV19]|uniref:DUF397 domain-containing protein n=1 Tax=Streptomyces sp. AV19 TaxID=2793068 RepID=UPI0018FE53A2|nr:DUF397 domain-containing protein [Streptomyces sp. AV19]MBH1932865.1 DUF397 domain-containing protein [Streptomyces sp. AV19]MDG4531543.1 DUF397 domain-containing protein [Streptomyces sp. AV19]